MFEKNLLMSGFLFSARSTNTHAASCPKKASEGASEHKPPNVPRESKKTPKRLGPRMAPRQNARKKGRTAKTGDKPSAAGTQRKKGIRPTNAVWGVPC